MKSIKFLLIVSFVASIVVFGGCSSSPSDQELQQLDQLKKDVASLEGQVRDKTAAKASLERQNNEKNSKLTQCRSDQDAVKKSLGK
ncbi:MAG: hypothetical protein ABSF91_10980 [Bacteroidota bacterium]|jgi:septal ring factor EnvC (AmiA/AmiB activator)